MALRSSTVNTLPDHLERSTSDVVVASSITRNHENGLTHVVQDVRRMTDFPMMNLAPESNCGWESRCPARSEQLPVPPAELDTAMAVVPLGEKREPGQLALRISTIDEPVATQMRGRCDKGVRKIRTLQGHRLRLRPHGIWLRGLPPGDK